MLMLAVIFLSLIFIFIKSLEISNEFLDLPRIPEIVSTSPTIISQSSGSDEYQNVCTADVHADAEWNEDDPSFNPTDLVSDCQDRTESISNLEHSSTGKAANNEAIPINNKCINDVPITDHATNCQDCAETISNIEPTSLGKLVDVEVIANNIDNQFINDLLSKDHVPNSQDQVVSDQKCTSFEKLVTDEASPLNKCIKDITLSNNQSDQLNFQTTSEGSALQSLRRMQVICSEMREALLSANIGSEKCSDSCDLYEDINNSASDNLESVAEISTLDKTTSKNDTYNMDRDLQPEIGNINKFSLFGNKSEMQSHVIDSAMEDEGSELNLLDVIDYSMVPDEGLMESEKTIQTFEPFKKQPENIDENHDVKYETVEKSCDTIETDDEFNRGIKTVTISRTVDNVADTNNIEEFDDYKGLQTDLPLVQLIQTPSTVSLLEMDEFLFWERLKDVLVRCQNNGQLCVQNILDYYGPIARNCGKFEVTRAIQGVSGVQSTRGGNRIIELCSEITQYLVDTNSFPQHIFKQESMNLTLGPLVVYVGGIGIDTPRREEDFMDGEENKSLCTRLLPTTSDESNLSLDNIQSKTISVSDKIVFQDASI